MSPQALLSVPKNPRLYAVLATALVLGSICHGQQAARTEPRTSLDQQIQSDLHLIQVATDEHLSKERLGYLWAVIAVDYRKAGDFQASESAYFKALELQRDSASATRNYATTLDNLGTLYLVFGRLEEAEHYNRMGEKIRVKMGYELDAARSEEHLAEIDLAKHRFKQAESEAAHALEVMRAQNDSDPLDLIGALNGLAFTRCLRNNCSQGLEDAQQSLGIARSSFGANSMPAAHASMAVGFALWKSGKLTEAEPAMRSAIETMKAQPVPAGRALLLALMEYRNYLRQERRDDDAELVEKQFALARLQLGRDCASCMNVRSLSEKQIDAKAYASTRTRP